MNGGKTKEVIPYASPMQTLFALFLTMNRWSAVGVTQVYVVTSIPK